MGGDSFEDTSRNVVIAKYTVVLETFSPAFNEKGNGSRLFVAVALTTAHLAPGSAFVRCVV